MSDDVVWDCIRHGHCSFMAKIETAIFCRNPYNATGICNRSSCPLANSRYATIRDHDGVFYLYMKTAERSHLPNKLWERVELPRNYEKAIEVINKHLEFWPKLLVHKIKQRLTKMTQYRIRMKKLQLKVREKIVTVPRKKALRAIRGEDKALKAAKIDNCIQRELFERLTSGCYNHVIYNHKYEEFMKILALKGEPVPEIEDEEFSVKFQAHLVTFSLFTGQLIYSRFTCQCRKMKSMLKTITWTPRWMTWKTLKGFLPIDTVTHMENDDLLLGLVEKKQKRSSSNSRSMVGKRSRKVITELEQDEDTNNRQKTLV